MPTGLVCSNLALLHCFLLTYYTENKEQNNLLLELLQLVAAKIYSLISYKKERKKRGGKTNSLLFCSIMDHSQKKHGEGETSKLFVLGTGEYVKPPSYHSL